MEFLCTLSDHDCAAAVFNHDASRFRISNNVFLNAHQRSAVGISA